MLKVPSAMVPVRSPVPARSPSPPPPPVARADSGASFREILAETLSGAARAERALGESVSRIARHRAGPEELIVLQAAVYRASRDFELLSKVIDKSAGAVRQALQSGQGG